MEEEVQQWDPEKGLELVTIGDGIQAIGYTTGTIKPGNVLTRTLHVKVVMKDGTYKFRQDIPLPNHVAGSNGIPVPG